MSCSSGRIARLRAVCAEAGIDAFLVRDTSGIRWFTGFDGVFDEERAHALLLTRGDNQGQWGFGVAFPHVDRGTVEISFNLLLEGPGNQACLGFEIRNNTPGRLIFGSATVQDFKIRNSRRKQVFSLTGDTWYKLKFTIPASKADGEQSRFEITDIKTGQSATMESPIKEYPNKLGLLCINTLPGKNNFKAFIDDVKVTVK